MQSIAPPPAVAPAPATAAAVVRTAPTPPPMVKPAAPPANPAISAPVKEAPAVAKAEPTVVDIRDRNADGFIPGQELSGEQLAQYLNAQRHRAAAAVTQS